MKQDKNQEYCFDIPDTSDEDEDQQNGPPELNDDDDKSSAQRVNEVRQ